MRYHIEVKRFIVTETTMLINISGSVEDPKINSHFLSKPKLVLHFDDAKEDRRIPFVLSDVVCVDGKCYFSGEYSYRLDLLFWKTRSMYLPFDMHMNFGFEEFYEEKVKVHIRPRRVLCDNKCYRLKIEDSCVSFLPDKLAIKKPAPVRGFVHFINGIVKFLQAVIAVGMLPLFAISAAIRFMGVIKMPKRFNDESTAKRFFAYIAWRFSKVSQLRISLWTVKKFIFQALYCFCRPFKVRKNRITFISLRRSDLTGNFAFVYNKLKNYENLDIRFILNEHTISEMSFAEMWRFARACASSKVVVLDEFTPQIHYINLKPQTKLIQLWHACGAFKTFGFTRLSKPMGSPQPTRNHRSYDYVTVSSTYCKKCHSEGFGISTDNVVATGIPRTDVFFDEDYKNRAREKFFSEFPHFKGKKIILFAPTFRGMVKETAFYPTEMFNIKKLLDEIPSDYAVIIKHHPFVRDRQHIPSKYADRVIDLSENSELNDLMFVSDVIITDYSSLVFEASLLDIPMIFYAFDLERYINERDFYFDFKLYVPGKIVYSLDGIINCINNEDYNTERIKPFADMFFDYRDGRSTDRVVKLITDCLDDITYENDAKE